MDGEPAARVPQPGRRRELAGDLRRDRRSTPRPAAGSGGCGGTSTPTPSCLTYGDARGRTWTSTRCSTSTGTRGGSRTVTGVHPTSRYGEMRVDGAAGGGVRREADHWPRASSAAASSSSSARSSTTWTRIRNLFLEQKPLQRLARDGQLSVYLHEGFWHAHGHLPRLPPPERPLEARGARRGRSGEPARPRLPVLRRAALRGLRGPRRLAARQLLPGAGGPGEGGGVLSAPRLRLRRVLAGAAPRGGAAGGDLLRLRLLLVLLG